MTDNTKLDCFEDSLSQNPWDPPEPTVDATAVWDEAMVRLKQTALQIKAERDRYEAAIVMIKNWKGYKPAPSSPFEGGLTNYELGANEMLKALRQIAEEALS